MSSGFGLPVLNLQSSLAALGTTYRDGHDREQQRAALARLGVQLQSGDYAGGAQTAFAAGDAGTGLGLLKLGETRRQTLLGERAAEDFARGMGGMSSAVRPDGGVKADVSVARRAAGLALDTLAASVAYKVTGPIGGAVAGGVRPGTRALDRGAGRSARRGFEGGAPRARVALPALPTDRLAIGSGEYAGSR